MKENKHPQHPLSFRDATGVYVCADCAENTLIPSDRWMPVLIGPPTHKCCLCGGVVFRSTVAGKVKIGDLPPDSHFEYKGIKHQRKGIYCIRAVDGELTEWDTFSLDADTMVTPRPDLDANVCHQPKPEAVFVEGGSVGTFTTPRPDF